MSFYPLVDPLLYFYKIMDLKGRRHSLYSGIISDTYNGTQRLHLYSWILLYIKGWGRKGVISRMSDTPKWLLKFICVLFCTHNHIHTFTQSRH